MNFKPPRVPLIVGVIGFVMFVAIVRFGNLCGTPVARFVWFCANSSQVATAPELSCNTVCHSPDDCPDPLYCGYDSLRLSGDGRCTGAICLEPAQCHCEGSDLVCPDGRRYPNAVADCVVPAGLCTCSGPTLNCPGSSLSSALNSLCYTPANSCGCSGHDEVCIFDGEVLLSRRNSPRCMAASSTTGCFQLCDPAAPSCDPDLTCTHTEDGVNRCMSGVDSTGFDCTTWPSLTGCLSRCDPDSPMCDPGLSCVAGPGPFHWCTGGTDADGNTCILPTPTPTVLAPLSGSFSTEGGACNDTCDPQAANCEAGLSCLPKSAGSSEYICWNSAICAASNVTPAVTEGLAVTEAPQQCAAGWLPLGGCVCCGSTLTCGDGTVAEFNPQCMGGLAPVCGDGVCGGGETCWTCSMDCGPC